MTTLDEFGANVRSDVREEVAKETEDDDTNGYGFRRSQCVAVSESTGERCGNPISRMGPDNDLCSVHERMDDVELIEGVDEP